MVDVLYDERAVQVLNSFRPYLGEKGNMIMDILDGLLDLLSSEPAQKFFSLQQSSGDRNARQFGEDKKKRGANPFTLFLILILLLLSDFNRVPGQKNNPGGDD
jgi:hypothetical protein